MSDIRIAHVLLFLILHLETGNVLHSPNLKYQKFEQSAVEFGSIYQNFLSRAGDLKTVHSSHSRHPLGPNLRNATVSAWCQAHIFLNWAASETSLLYEVLRNLMLIIATWRMVPYGTKIQQQSHQSVGIKCNVEY